MRFLLILSVLTVLLTAGAPEAQAATYTMSGAGIRSCGSWSAHSGELNSPGPVTQGLPSRTARVGMGPGVSFWYGFIHNNDGDPLDSVDAEGARAWIDNYCRAHPIENIGDAAAAFYFAHPHRCRRKIEMSLGAQSRDDTPESGGHTSAKWHSEQTLG